MRWRTVFGASVITGALGILLVARLVSGTEGRPTPTRQPPLEGASLVVAPHCAPPGRERTVTLTNNGPKTFVYGMWTGRIEHDGLTTHIVSFEPDRRRPRLMKVADIPDEFGVDLIGYVGLRGESTTWRFTPSSAGDSTLILGGHVSSLRGTDPRDIAATFRTSYRC